MVLLLALAGSAPTAFAQSRPEFPGNPDLRNEDLQPTEAEVTRRLEEEGAAKGSVDTSPHVGQEVDQLYQELMKDTPPQSPPPQPR